MERFRINWSLRPYAKVPFGPTGAGDEYRKNRCTFHTPTDRFFQAVFGIGMIVGPIILGSIGDLFGLTIGFIVVGVLGTFAMSTIFIIK